MVSTTSFGSFPGVKVQTIGNAVTGATIGREQKLVLFGSANLGGSAGSATLNEPTQVRNGIDATRKFGDGSDLTEAVQQALANGANSEFLYGVPVEAVSVTGETESGVSTFSLDNAPLVEDASTITVSDTVDSNDLTVELTYEGSPTQPSQTDTAVVNPLTGEVAVDSSSDFSVDYDYYDYSTAINTNTGVVNQAETGLMAVVTEAESVAGTLSGVVNDMRSEYRMVSGVAGVEFNTEDSDGNPKINVGSYSDSIDNDAMFLAGPTRTGSGGKIIGAIAGNMAGARLQESVYNSSLTGSFTDVEQDLPPADVDTLADANVIPIEDKGSISMVRNQSTSEADGYERDFFVRRIIDQTVLIAREIGDSIVGRINDEGTRRTAENQVRAELAGLAGSDLIEANGGDEKNYTVNFFEKDQQTVGVDLGITPNGITKRVDTTLTIAV